MYNDKLKVSSDKNPIIPRRGVCDPHMHVFNDRVYLYASHDAISAFGKSDFEMPDWQVWSSSDCVEWQLDSVIRPEDTFVGKMNSCWAVDCAERNGKYYFYFSIRSTATGVLVADDPAGPFKDVLGKPLLDGTRTETAEYDPSVFCDDDGEYYIIFGGPKWCYGSNAGYYIARLNEDMVSLAEEPRYVLINHIADDKPSLNKFGGRYYLSYGGYYAISDCVYGPYRLLGNTGASEDHTSYFEWNSQIFNAISVGDSFGSHRSTGMCYVHIRKNGELVTDPLIVEYGVGRYDSNWNRIEAEWFMSGKNVHKEENLGVVGFSVVCDGNAVLKFPNVKNLSDKIGLWLCGSSWFGESSIELRENDENGKLLGSTTFEATYGCPYADYTTLQRKAGFFFDAQLPDTANLCLVLKPTANAKLSIDYFRFFAEPISNP